MTPISLHDILESHEYQEARSKSKLAFALGQDETGQARFCDIAQAGHILIGGSTGSGKSMLLRVLVASILTHASPSDVQFLMIDPMGMELNLYNGVPHLFRPVATDIEQAVSLLADATSEMERRYQLFSQADVYTFSNYQKVRMERKAQTELVALPAMVLIIDGLDYLMMVTRKDQEVEGKISKLVQRASATGIHLVMAAQRPSDDLLPGCTKANIPTRIAFIVAVYQDSRTILGRLGAEELHGCGDMLYLSPDGAFPLRIQGAYVTDQDAKTLAT